MRISGKIFERKALVILISSLLLIAVTVGAVQLFGFYLPAVREKKERDRLVREYYASKLSTYEKENAKYGDYEVDVAFLGDSLTDGYDLGKYYPNYRVANRGIGGETSFGLEERLDVSLYELKPKVAVILIGGNNLDTMLENYERMLADITSKLPKTKLIICSLTAMGGNFAHKNKTAAYNNAVIEKLASEYGCRFVDLFGPLLNTETGAIYDEYTSDGAHLTPLGYEVLTEAIEPNIAYLIGK